MCSIPRMTRLNDRVDEALNKYAESKEWTLSFTIAKLIETSPYLKDFFNLCEKTDGKAA